MGLGDGTARKVLGAQRDLNLILSIHRETRCSYTELQSRVMGRDKEDPGSLLDNWTAPGSVKRSFLQT